MALGGGICFEGVGRGPALVYYTMTFFFFLSFFVFSLGNFICLTGIFEVSSWCGLPHGSFLALKTKIVVCIKFGLGVSSRHRIPASKADSLAL